MLGKPKPLWDDSPLKSGYDAVIIGGGLHGLATAYFLARDHGMTDVAIVERRYIGYGGAGRNTAIVRANQRTSENIPLYKEALEMWPTLTRELDFNLMFFNCGNLNLAHGEAALSAMRLHVASAQFHGVESELVDPKGCKELVPLLDITDRPKYPVFGGMYHPPGGIVRHDAVVWGLAKGAAKRGVRIHQRTEATGIGVENGKVVSVETDRGTLRTPRVLNAAGAYAAAVSWHLLGTKLPIDALTIQAMVTQPIKPLLHHVVSSGAYHCYANQTLKGEIATGAHMDPWPNYAIGTTPGYFKHQAEALVDFMPGLGGLRFMRIWGGLADMTPDMAPILDGHVPAQGYFLDAGWGYFGFKSCAVAGKYMAEFMATGETPEILEPFALDRFRKNRLMGETAGAIAYGPWN